MTHVAYCRVSSSDQNLDAQLAAVKTAGATKIFREKESGAYEARPQLMSRLPARGRRVDRDKSRPPKGREEAAALVDGASRQGIGPPNPKPYEISIITRSFSTLTR
jgi:hypothetical protein